MSSSDGRIVGTTTLIDNGVGRFNVVVVGDGYQDAELPTFATDAQGFCQSLLATPPFDQMRRCINFYRIDVASTDSGADDPAACGGTGATPATYFDATFCNNGIQRLLTVDVPTVRSVVNAQVPAWNMIVVIVNHTQYGGSGGAVAVFSRAAGAAEIGIHEMGHTAFGLADEYQTYAGCGSGEAGHDTYAGTEPAQANVTANTDPTTLKWSSLVNAATPIPTTVNPNCAQCDFQASPVAAGTVGLFGGAFYFHCGAYRPEYDCKMRTLGQPFCAVCRQRITAVIQPYCPLVGDFPGPDPNRVVG